jgi:voltage-gated potassium channel
MFAGMFSRPARPASPGYQVFMLIMCLFSIGILAFHVSRPSDPGIAEILGYADFAVCMIFLVDFMLSVARAQDRWRYLWTWGWIDLLSSIPTLDVARWGRVARVLRIARVIRGLRATQLIAGLLIKNRAENAMLAVSAIALMLVTICSIAILQFETAAGGNIQSAGDALWWAITTITTVGYGDRYPTTHEGRLVAVILMSAGVGLFGTFSAFLASRFVGEDEESTNSEIVLLREEIARLRTAIENRER